MAYFFFDFRDAQKQHRRDLLSSLLFQLSARSDTCHHIFSRFYLDHDEGAQNPSDGALSKCLMDMLSAEGQPPTYIIIDALDESPNISGMPSAREKVLQFLEDLVSSQLPNVHICVSSRTEIDIWVHSRTFGAVPCFSPRRKRTDGRYLGIHQISRTLRSKHAKMDGR
jgi:hypothetical protein